MNSRFRRVAFLALCAIIVVGGCDRRSASTFTPEDSDADYQRGKSLERQGNQSEALAEFLKVIAKRGDDEAPESHLEAGLIYQQHIKDQIAAIYHFRKFLELDPTSRQADLVRQRIAASKREFARTLPADPEQNSGVKLGYLDQIDQLQRENDRLKAEISALRAALPPGVNLPALASSSSSSSASSDGFDIPIAAPSDDASAPAPQAGPNPNAPILRAPLSGDGLNMPASAQAATSRPQPRPQPSDASPTRHYTVKSGDTLYNLAQRFYGNRTRWKEIYEANREVLKSERGMLRIGMELKIP